MTASFFVTGAGLALAPKMYPDQSQAFKEVNDSQAFTVGRKHGSFWFMYEPLPSAVRLVCTTFRATT